MKSLSYFFLIILSISCNSIDDGIKPTPDCSEKGSCNIMTCKVKEQNWKADCVSGFYECDPVTCYFYKKDSLLTIFGESLTEPLSNIRLGIQFKDSLIGHFGLIDSLRILVCPNCNPNKPNYNFYHLDSTYNSKNQLEILKLDFTTRTIEGKFNIRVIEHQIHDTIYISDGYFKLTYYY